MGRLQCDEGQKVRLLATVGIVDLKQTRTRTHRRRHGESGYINSISTPVKQHLIAAISAWKLQTRPPCVDSGESRPTCRLRLQPVTFPRFAVADCRQCVTLLQLSPRRALQPTAKANYAVNHGAEKARKYVKKSYTALVRCLVSCFLSNLTCNPFASL